MRTVALLIGIAFCVLGVVGFVVPSLLLDLGHHAATPVGLWGVSLVRLAIGTTLYAAARSARNPTALRLLGALFIVSGVITPFFGAAHARALVDAFFAGGNGPIRLWSALVAALGAFIAYTVSDSRRVAYRPATSARL